MEQNGAEVAMRPCGCVEHSWVDDHVGGHGEACVYCSLQIVIVRTSDRVGHTQVGDHVGGPGDGHRTA